MDKNILYVKTLKELPGVPMGTILKKPTSGKWTGDWMSPECIDKEGKYIISYEWSHFSDGKVDKFPDFFQKVYCECKCCHCIGCNHGCKK